MNNSSLSIAFLLCCTLAVLSFFNAHAQESGISDKPNVVFIAIEDFNPEHIGSYGGQVKTPNIDRLASEGVIFKNAYSQVPVCNPNRTALFTGLRPPNSGVFTNRDNYKEMVLPDLPVTMPQQFMRNGYMTVKRGKMYHKRWNGGHDESWDRTLPRRVEGREILSSWSGRVKSQLNKLEGIEGGGWFAENLHWGPIDVEPEVFRDGHSAISAGKFLAEEHDKPFFLGLGFSAPHVKFAAPKQFFDLYELEDITIPDNPPNDLVDMPSINGKNSIHSVLDSTQWREIKRAQFATMSYVDWCVGKVLDAIEQNGLEQNTIVVVWTDHGFALGEHYQWGKGGQMIEEINKVGMIWKVPGVTPQGITSTSVVETIDIFPSLFDLTNIPIPDHVEGESMAELLKNPQKPGKKAAYTWSTNGNRVSIQTGPYRLNVDRDLDPASFELYDHKFDPGEYVNLSCNPQYKPVIERLISYYKDHRERYSLFKNSNR